MSNFKRLLENEDNWGKLLFEQLFSLVLDQELQAATDTILERIGLVTVFGMRNSLPTKSCRGGLTL